MATPAILIAPARLALAVFPALTEGDTGPGDSVAKEFAVSVNGGVSADRVLAVCFGILEKAEGSDEVEGPLSTSDMNLTSLPQLNIDVYSLVPTPPREFYRTVTGRQEVRPPWRAGSL